MIPISYTSVMIGITLLWIMIRAAVCCKTKNFNWKREAQLILVYICIVVVARFTFFPFSKVDGKIQPLIFDSANWLNFRINLLPFVYLMDYEIRREALINVIGNTAMFIPLGIVWPAVFPQLNTHGKRIAAGFGCSLVIEILQLPFFERYTDLDDLILNTAGFLLGYGIWLLVKKLKK
jgi:glycopeptide antibiotics resistance protein